MRIAFAFTLFAWPAAAWQFSPSPICTLTETTVDGTLTITYDASLPEYVITITLPDTRWPKAPEFAMAFSGNQPIALRTERHQLSDDRRSLTVTDTGFGNVLNGLEFNLRAYATSGGTTVGFTLTDIGPAIRDFRNCPAANVA
ncbi:excinuclease ABC subunit B [Cognatiyoonia sp. IB215446]|uniref:excinuclease ABC subunit B n=1 Tax=Cognatiyoonia sp. IB215446 TaxID=3097355 RepID=UPI002A0C1836|nr:excinuclease ABC subunit B [Cognatiyoonia sp. IB215446]MDX8347914.1 excinuclease ABC subunit B [Cognatiyoonia sp. IB215446]